MDFPKNCIKGIPNSAFLGEDGTVGSHLFYFKENHARGDGWIEQSVNWEDDGLAIAVTLGQRKGDGELQFKAGAAIIPRSEIDRLNRRPLFRDLLSYERAPLEDNPYHGNLLLKEDVPKSTMKTVASGLALAITRIVRE